jgi:hypothetical protein
MRGADEIEYFAYLRSLVFDGDLDFENEYRHFVEADPEGLSGFEETFLGRREPATGRPINFGPLGSALLWSPFYLLAHAGVVTAAALGSDVRADGYSWPYLAAACYASALYGFIGLLLIHDALRRHAGVREPAASLSVAALWLGTPVLYYMTIAAGFSHACSLFAVALIVVLTLRLDAREDTTVLDWAGVGAACGVAGLVREQDALFGLLPAAAITWRALRDRHFAGSVVKGAALAAAAALVFVPQLFAYRAINGSFGPSDMVGRKMSWISPHFFEVLFNPGNGLFAWSPLLLVATLGLAYGALRGTLPRLLPVLAGMLLLQVWINGAVESWTQAGAFGSRRFVASTVVFAFGLAFVTTTMTNRWGRAFATLVLATCVWWNVSLMVQFGLNLMDRQHLKWPDVAVNQFTQVPRHLGRATSLFFTDRERLVEESR